MEWSKRPKRPSTARALSFWTEALTDAAREGAMVRIACSPEDHAAIRAEAERVGRLEGCEVQVGMPTPRLASVTFTPCAQPG